MLDPGQIGVDGGEHPADGDAEGLNGTNAHDGDQTDEHAVFDESRALVILGVTSNQITHGLLSFKVNNGKQAPGYESGVNSAFVQGRPVDRCLDPGQIGVDGGEHPADGDAEGSDGTDADDGDQADEHAVFDQGRALVVLRETINKITHGKKILFKG
jgi:hypothetical protein